MENNPYLDPSHYIYGPEFYRSLEGRQFLSATDGGKFAFTWEAEYDDGIKITQFDALAQERALTDDSFIPSDAPYKSTSHLDRDKVTLVRLMPIAHTVKVLPFLANMRWGVRANLEAGERFLAYWLMSMTPSTGVRLARHVIGREFPDGRKELTVVSPSGAVKMCDNDNQSYEGE